MSLLDMLAERYESPRDWYRSYYKYTACGPSLGVEVPGRGWLWCDRLRELGSFEEMRARGEEIVCVAVSSIVEGTDAEVPARKASWADLAGDDPLRSSAGSPMVWARFDALVDDVDAEAKLIWDDTHGCDACAAHWREESGHEDIEAGCQVWDGCPECKGDGVAL